MVWRACDWFDILGKPDSRCVDLLALRIMATATAPSTQNTLKRQTATVDCPKSMVGRVIGKSGETIKALQTYTGALIQIDQTVEPTSEWAPTSPLEEETTWAIIARLRRLWLQAGMQQQQMRLVCIPMPAGLRLGLQAQSSLLCIFAEVTISGTPHSLSLAVSMVTDIVKGTFKGFALLRQITNPGGARAGPLANPMAQPRPVYAPGYGLIPPSQVSRACPGIVARRRTHRLPRCFVRPRVAYSAV